MADRIGGIFVDIGVNSAAFDKGLTRAQGQIGKFSANTRSSLGKLGGSAFSGLAAGALGVIAPLLSAGAAINGAKAALEEFGNIADAATAAGLDAEFFQAIAYQASLGGVAIDQVSTALATFAKNAGLAAEGKGRMVSTLKELDPVLLENIRQARNQEERLKLVADALAKTTDASKRAAIATAAFGDAGAKLAGVFAGGAAQIDAMAAKAKDLGLIVDRELIARADQLGDEFDTTTKIVDLQLKQALVNLGPVLVWLSGLAGNMASAIGTVIEGTKSLADQSTGNLEKQLAALNGASAMPNPLGLPTDVFGADAAKREEITAELRRRAMESLRTQLTSTPPTTTDVPTLEEVATREAAAAAAVKQAEAVKALIADLEFEKLIVGESTIEQQILTTLRNAGVEATSAQGLAIRRLLTELDAERAAIEANTEAMAEFRDLASSATRSFIDDLLAGKSAAEAFGNVLNQIGNKLLDLGATPLFGRTFNLEFA